MISKIVEHRLWSRKNVHIILVSITSVEETPLFRGKGHFFWVPKPGFKLHLGDTLTTQNVTDPNRVDKIKCTLITMITAITT